MSLVCRAELELESYSDFPCDIVVNFCVMKPLLICVLILSQATPCTHCHCGGKRQTSPNHKQPPATAKSPSTRRQKKAPVAKESAPVNATVTVEVKNSERITESTEITPQVTADERREGGGGVDVQLLFFYLANVH